MDPCAIPVDEHTAVQREVRSTRLLGQDWCLVLPETTFAAASLPCQAAGIRRSTISAHQEHPAGIASSSKLYSGWWTGAVSPLPTRM